MGRTYTFVEETQSFDLIRHEKKEWLVYLSKRHRLVIENVNSLKQYSVSDVLEYVLDIPKNVLVLKREMQEDDKKRQRLFWIRLPDTTGQMIWEGMEASSLVLDAEKKQLAFVAQQNEKTAKAIGIYKAGSEQAVLLNATMNNKDKQNVAIESIQRFCGNGLLLSIKKQREEIAAPSNAVRVDIWSYLDRKLIPEAMAASTMEQRFSALLNLNNGTVLTLNDENEEVQDIGRDDYMVMTRSGGANDYEWYWNKSAEKSFHLLSLPSGEKVKLHFFYPFVSPTGRYLIGSDLPWIIAMNNYLIFDFGSKKYYRLTKDIAVDSNAHEIFGLNCLKDRGLIVAGWLEKDEALLLYDKYDIWQIDPRGKLKPINLTNGYGRKHAIIFRLNPLYPEHIFAAGSTIIIKALDEKTKNEALYSIKLGQPLTPHALTKMDPFSNGDLVKARDANVFIIRRENASVSANNFWTSDFRQLMPLSDVHPEKKYNWLTAELTSWISADGTSLQGVIYKPENFDSTRKYPVIMNFYEKVTNELHKYPYPGTTDDKINIAWFVSHGYVVFTPDISFTIGKTGESALNAVVSGAKHLSGFKWIDEKHIGIQGHSFGGFEVNYIVAHTSMFAAAMASSGASDLIEDYGGLMDRQTSKQFYFEVSQYRLGCSPWESRETYINNSPILDADKIVTPLLMMNNKKDGAVAFEQGVGLFTALRRLGKKVWMLQYDNGNHSLYPGSREAIQHTIRLTQFFDHYLKGSPAPRWMTRSVGATGKGSEDNLELDPEMGGPPEGLLIEKNEYLEKMR
jgi:hypothetical protein